jgi:hypothetical protein
MMEAVRTSETSVDNQFTRQYNPEDSSEHPARNAIYAHAQDFPASDELLLAILKAFIPQPQEKQQSFMCSDEFSVIHCRTLSQHPQYTVQVHSLHATLNCLMFSVCM